MSISNQISNVFFYLMNLINILPTKVHSGSATAISLMAKVNAEMLLFSLLILSCLSTWAIGEDNWAVHLVHMNSKKIFSPQEASDFAKSIYMVNLGQIGGLEGYYLFSPTVELIKATATAMNVTISGQNGLEREDVELSISSLLLASPVVKWFERQVIRIRSYRKSKAFHMRHFSTRSYLTMSLNDPLFPQQWHLVWNQSITGKGVTVALIDDGIDFQHADLRANYNPKLSYDFVNRVSNASYKRWNETHGTQCAGEIVAAPNNNICGVGVAFHANISCESTDAMEAQALNYEWDGNHIYSSSWGPKDDGSELEGPGYLAVKAMEAGIQKGRKGKGSIYVFASGNGGDSGDNCNFDGYSNSIYTVTVGSIDHTGQISHYAEECAAHLAVTFSGGRGLNIITTGVNNTCSLDHSGTSAAAPLAAGMIALALSVRPDLSWRDVQHLIVSTAKMTDPQDKDWKKNGAGYYVNHKYGFGQMDAFELVESAKKHKSLPLNILTMTKSDYSGTRIPFGGKTDSMLVREIQLTATEAWESGLSLMEHVQVQIRLRHKERRYLTITLVCPSGTTSVLAVPRVNDDSEDGFNPWTFMTVRCWGESPIGTWKLMIHDARYVEKMDEPIESGDLYSWSLNLHGTCVEEDMETNPATNERKCTIKGSTWMIQLAMIIGLSLFGLILICAICCLCYYRFKRKREKRKKERDEEATVFIKEDIRKKMEKDLHLMKKYQLDISHSSSQVNIARSAAEIEPLPIQPLELSRSVSMKYVPEEAISLTTKPVPQIQKPTTSRFQPLDNSELSLSSSMDKVMFEVKKNTGKPIMTTKIASDVLMARTKQTADLNLSSSFPDLNSNPNQSSEVIPKPDVKVKPGINPNLLEQELPQSDDISRTLPNPKIQSSVTFMNTFGQVIEQEPSVTLTSQENVPFEAENVGSEKNGNVAVNQPLSKNLSHQSSVTSTENRDKLAFQKNKPGLVLKIDPRDIKPKLDVTPTSPVKGVGDIKPASNTLDILSKETESEPISRTQTQNITIPKMEIPKSSSDSFPKSIDHSPLHPRIPSTEQSMVTSLKTTDESKEPKPSEVSNFVAADENKEEKPGLHSSELEVRPSRSSRPRPTGMLPPSRESLAQGLDPMRRSLSNPLLSTVKVVDPMKLTSRTTILAEFDKKQRSDDEISIKSKKASRFEKLKRQLMSKKDERDVDAIGRSISTPHLNSLDKNASKDVHSTSHDAFTNDSAPKFNLKVDTTRMD